VRRRARSDSTEVAGPVCRLEQLRITGLLRCPSICRGFRSAFRDWAGDATDFPREIAEEALDHKVGDNTELAYRRGDAIEKRPALMDAWCAFCGATGGD
jgi:hypothetical protein